MKSFYINGKVRQTFWYINGLREDSAKWLYENGKVFRSTPYKKDTIDGIQIQYFMNGKIKARLGYKKGLRTTFLEEIGPDGKLISGYPELIVKTKDDYRTKGSYRISLELSDKSIRVRYYIGDLSTGIFDTAHVKLINEVKGIGTIDFKKTGSPKAGNVGVIAEVLTNYGNNYFIFKKIGLPYNDLN